MNERTLKDYLWCSVEDIIYSPSKDRKLFTVFLCRAECELPTVIKQLCIFKQQLKAKLLPLRKLDAQMTRFLLLSRLSLNVV